MAYNQRRASQIEESNETDFGKVKMQPPRTPTSRNSKSVKGVAADFSLRNLGVRRLWRSEFVEFIPCDMSIKIVLSPYKDPSYGLDESEQAPAIKKRIEEYLLTCPKGRVEYRMEETDHGIGLDWATITLEVLSIAGCVFFGIPALHKKIRDTITEWKKIKKTVDYFLEWLGRKESLMSYSIEKAFLDALEYLESKTDILELELIEAIEIPGKSGYGEAGFKTSPLLYYLFIFREQDEQVFILLFTSKLKMLFCKSVRLDPRFVDD